MRISKELEHAPCHQISAIYITLSKIKSLCLKGQLYSNGRYFQYCYTVRRGPVKTEKQPECLSIGGWLNNVMGTLRTDTKILRVINSEEGSRTGECGEQNSVTLETFQGEFNHTTNTWIQTKNINVLTDSRFRFFKIQKCF